jgi:hypothetical protein
MRRLVPIATTLAALLLAGCQTTETKTEPAPETPAKSRYSETDIMLFEASGYRTMNATELAAQAETLRKAYLAQKNEENRLRLGVFLAVAPPPHGDRARALTLLDVPPNEANGRGRTHPIALLLIPLLQDNKRLEDALGSTQQRLRDEARHGEALQQNSDALQKKLDAIREIERRMLDRNTRQQK